MKECALGKKDGRSTLDKEWDPYSIIDMLVAIILVFLALGTADPPRFPSKPKPMNQTNHTGHYDPKGWRPLGPTLELPKKDFKPHETYGVPDATVKPKKDNKMIMKEITTEKIMTSTTEGKLLTTLGITEEGLPTPTTTEQYFDSTTMRYEETTIFEEGTTTEIPDHLLKVIPRGEKPKQPMLFIYEEQYPILPPRHYPRNRGIYSALYSPYTYMPIY